MNSQETIAAESQGWLKNTQLIGIFGGGLLLLTALLFVSLTQGVADISVRTVIAAFVHPQQTTEQLLIRGFRMPRALIGLLAGAALAVSGALLQTISRNPLASASTLGINAGAYFAIVAATVFLPAWTAKVPLLLALIGGCGAAATAFLMAGGNRSTPVRLVLAGMIVTLVLASFTGALQLLYENETTGLFVWGSGSLVQNDWSGVLYAWPWVIGSLAVIMPFARSLDLIELGEDTARSLGQRTGWLRLSALALAVLMAAVTVSVVGPIGFIGLMAPHLVKLAGLRRHRVLLPACALWGAVILTGADIVARLFHSSLGELPAGSVTAAIGAPWLIWLALRVSRNGSATEGTTASMSIGLARRSLPYPLLVAVAAILLGTMLLLGVGWSGTRLPLADLISVLTGGGSDFARMMVLDFRLPRSLVAGLAGAGLAVAGVLIQGAVRNPLADPSIIGVTSGAGFGALLLLVIWPHAPGGLMPAAALVGAVAAATFVYALSWRKGLNPVVLILIGIAVSAIGAAGIQFLVIKSSLTAAPALAWLAGSTYARGWRECAILAGALVVLLPLAWLLGRRADLLAFGDQIPLGLGLRLRRTRLICAALGVAMAAITVACVGTIGFIGLLAPHAVRMLVGQNHRKSVVLSALAGAALLTGADWLGKVLLAPKEIPAGLIAALLGAPYLLFLMTRSMKRG